jgi:hypothetical protein
MVKQAPFSEAKLSPLSASISSIPLPPMSASPIMPQSRVSSPNGWVFPINYVASIQ